jgi:peptide/nickel transport system substrate-binding protein
MTRLNALAAASVVIAALLVCSCAGPPAALKPIDTAELVLTTPAGDKVVDHINWGLSAGEPATLDPVKVGDESSNIINGNLCENLLLLGPDFSAQPNLATSADWADDTTFVIKLRRDVRFWDGTPMTAQDVAFSLQRNMDPKSGSVYESAFMNAESVDATAPDEVTVHFTAHDSQFRNTMSSPAGAVFEKDFTGRTGEAVGTPDGGVMCTGPYKLDKWLPGDRISTSANRDYWGPIKPKVQSIDYRFLRDDATLTTALAAGELDGAYSLPQASINTLRGAKSGTVYFGPSTASIGFGPAGPTGPAADPTLRVALDLAIDKKKFIDTALGGYASPLKTFIPPLAFRGTNQASIYQAGYDALDADNYNLARAKELMSTVHLERTHLVCAIQAGQQASLTAATILQAAGRELGLDIEIRQMQAVDFSNVFYDENARQGIDFVGTTAYIDTPGVLTYASEFATPDGLFNWPLYDNPEVTEALGEARSDADPAASARAFVRAQAMYAPAKLQITLAQQYSTLYLDNDLTGATVSFAYINSPWALHLGGK